jgi:hypothetical protein
MKHIETFHITTRFSLEISEAANNEVLVRYLAKLIDDEQGNDRSNHQWKVQLVSGETYSLAYQQVLANELIMFGSLTECLNHVHAESRKILSLGTTA